MTKVLEAIASRYTCRDYKDEGLSKVDLEAIAQAAIQSPSAMDYQGWQIIMVDNRELVEELDAASMSVLAAAPDTTMYDRIMSRGGKMFYNAPCMVFIATEQEKADGYGKMDCGIVAQNIALAAHSLGIASTICGMAGLALMSDQKDALMERLQIKEGYTFGIAVLLGYANTTKEPHEPNQAKITWID